MTDLLNDFRQALAPYNGLQPSELTPEIVTELFSITFQYMGRLMVSGAAPPKRGRPPKEPKPKSEPLAIVDDHIELKTRRLTPDEARELGALLFRAADQLQGEETYTFDDFLEAAEMPQEEVQ